MVLPRYFLAIKVVRVLLRAPAVDFGSMTSKAPFKMVLSRCGLRCGRMVLGWTIALASFSFMPTCAQAEDLTALGGDLSSDLPGRNAIQVVAPNVTDGDRRAAQIAGFSPFHRIRDRSDGLGPRFINKSCGGCHVNNGRGPTTLSSAATNGSAMVVKVKRPGLRSDGSIREVRGIGSQVLDHNLRGDRSRSVKLSWRSISGTYRDGTPYRLRRPKLSFSSALRLPASTVVSLRMSPAVIGMGLLEAISDETVIAASDPYDSNGDGISGRVAMVPDRATGDRVVGRFGFKATEPSVVQQSAAALYHDMQITNPLFFNSPSRVEVSQEPLHSLAIYLRLAGVPKARDQQNTSVVAGQEVFTGLGCEACHTKTVTTSATYQDPELRNQTIHPFTDLLLHDMGSGLADGWSEFSAGGREWRTAPLWGLGFAAQLSERSPVYLHDGRARSIEEAILWHGGEAAAAQRGFTDLSAVERQQLLDFLASL